MIELREDDIVLCTVRRIEGTSVFLDIEGNGQGTMIFSEVSPGRIRNIRDFVFPNKKIVCKILRIRNNHPELSFRRVTTKEKEEVLERDKKEKALINMIKPVLKEKIPEVLQKIKEKYDLADFLDEARENPGIIKKFFTPKQTKELTKIFTEKKEKEKEVKRTITLKTNAESGLSEIKKTLSTNKAKIRYIGSSNFSISVKAKDYKTANSDLEAVIEQIKNKAKLLKINIKVKEK